MRIKTVKGLLTTAITGLFALYSLSNANPTLEFSSYYTDSPDGIIMLADGDGNKYVISAHQFGLNITKYNSNFDKVWSKDISPSGNTFTQILSSKGINDNTIDLTPNTYIKDSGNDRTIVNISNSCVYRDWQGNLQLEDPFVLYDAVIDRTAIYIIGRSCDPNFPVVGGSDLHYSYEKTSSQNTNGGITTSHTFAFNKDAYILKISVSDGKILYSTYYGSYQDEEGKGIYVDDNQNIYITGYTTYDRKPDSTNYPALPQVGAFSSILDISQYNQNSGGINCNTQKYKNGFVAILGYNTTGNGYSIIKSSAFGSYCQDEAVDITLDSNKNIYVIGHTYAGSDTDYKYFPPTLTSPIARQIDNPATSGIDLFIMKLNSNFQYVNTLLFGSNANDTAVKIETDLNGNIYVLGYTPTKNPNLPNYQDGGCYIVAFNNSFNYRGFNYIDIQNNPIKVQQRGDRCSSMSLNVSGNIYIGGALNNDAFITEVSFKDNQKSTTDTSTKILAGNDYDEVLNVFVDGAGLIYVSGQASAGFPVKNVPSSSPLSQMQNTKNFIAILSTTQSLAQNPNNNSGNNTGNSSGSSGSSGGGGGGGCSLGFASSLEAIILPFTLIALRRLKRRG